jgi:hypothetical protein
VNLYDAIQTRYGFAIPDEYREMEQAGLFDAKTDEGADLWMQLDLEWLPPEGILDYTFADYHKPGFVPFAGNCAGDAWCWWPEQTSALGTPVVLCPHDDMEGKVDAPNFQGAIYRRILDYANGMLTREDEPEARKHLRWFAREMKPYFMPRWIETIESLAARPFEAWQHGRLQGEGFCSYHEYLDLVKRDLDFPRLGEKFTWHKD